MTNWGQTVQKDEYILYTVSEQKQMEFTEGLRIDKRWSNNVQNNLKYSEASSCKEKGICGVNLEHLSFRLSPASK